MEKGIGITFNKGEVQIVYGEYEVVQNWVIYNEQKAYGQSYTSEEQLSKQLGYYTEFYGNPTVTAI